LVYATLKHNYQCTCIDPLNKKERIRIGGYAIIVQLKDELSSKMGIDRLLIAQQLRQAAIGSESSSQHPECADKDVTRSFIRGDGAASRAKRGYFTGLATMRPHTPVLDPG
jgi:hypothetical protein